MEKETFEGNYWQWLKHQIKTGTNLPAMAILAFGVGFQLCLMLTTGKLDFTSVIAFIASSVGLFCTTLMMNGSPANGLMGFISAFGFIYINAIAHHWWSVVDQIVFVMLIDLPLMKNWRTWGQNFDQKVRSLNKKGWAITIASILCLWIVLYPLAIQLKDSQPLIDALVLAVGAVASWLCYKHYNNTYTLWLFSNAINVVLWIGALQTSTSIQATLPMLVTTLLYMSTSIYAKFFSVWKK